MASPTRNGHHVDVDRSVARVKRHCTHAKAPRRTGGPIDDSSPGQTARSLAALHSIPAATGRPGTRLISRRCQARWRGSEEPAPVVAAAPTPSSLFSTECAPPV